MSPGLLVYYFKGKDEVLFWMVRHANRVIMDEVVQKLRIAQTPWERLMAIVEGNFPESLYNRNTANAWLSFYAASSRDKQLERLQTLFYRRLSSNLRSCVKDCLEPPQLQQFVQGVGLLIDGCWLRKGGVDVSMTAVQVVSLIAHYMINFLGEKKVQFLKTTPN